MRDHRRWLPLLFVACVFGSCTCHQQVEQTAGSPNLAKSGIADRPAGFDTGQKDLKLGQAPAAPAMPPTPNQAPPPPAQGDVAEIPADFPSDVKLMQDAELANVREMAQNAHAVLVRTEQELPQVYSFYESDLKSKGWTLEQNYQAENQAFLGFRRGNTILNMTIAKDPNNPGKRLVNIMYQEDQKPDFDEF